MQQPRYGTQGGGEVEFDHLNGRYVFVKAPTWKGAPKVGDFLPAGWSITGPINPDECLRNPAYDGPQGIFADYGEQHDR
jgi:hypothetical protein